MFKKLFFGFFTAGFLVSHVFAEVEHDERHEQQNRSEGQESTGTDMMQNQPNEGPNSAVDSEENDDE